MKRISRHLIAFGFSIALLTGGLSVSAMDFSDVSGHWAEKNLRKAYEDGYLTGFEDSTMRPDAPITEAEILTILCRSLQAQNRVAASTLGLSGQEWYADAAEQAAAMQLLSNGGRLSEGSLSRAQAFLLLTKAFQLTEAIPDDSSLMPFQDRNQLSPEERQSFLMLLRWGGLKGYEDHTLRPNASITRSEFITMLYQIAPYQISASQLTETPKGAVLLSGEATIQNQTFSSPLFLDCSTEQLSLRNVTAELVVARSQKSSGIEVKNGSQIQRLILSGGDGSPARIIPDQDARIETLVVGDRSGNLTIGGNVNRLEVTGNGQIITVDTALTELEISGTGCQIIFTKNASVRNIHLSEASSLNHLILTNDVSQLILDGSNNTVSISALVETLSLYGPNNQLTGSGSIGNLILYTSRSTVSIPYETIDDKRDRGIEDSILRISAPEQLPIGETLKVTATVLNPQEKTCKAIWLVDGNVVKEETLTVGPQEKTLVYTRNFAYTADLNPSCSVTFQLVYLTQDGAEQKASANASIRLENYSKEYYEQYSKERVLSRVSTGYQGDYTLAWAEQNDYDRQTKEIWVNAKGYSSQTKYLIWINISHQRVNIFEGSKGNWTLHKSYLVGTGAKGTDTPVGVYTVGTRTKTGWTTDTYNVRPVLRFKMGSGLAFHSRIYDPNYTRIIDGSIGFPVSHGCIRMYDEDVWWMYQEIPQNTTVVVY